MMKKLLPLFLLLCVSYSITFAQSFSAINEDGLTLYYEVVDDSAHTAKVIAAPDGASYYGAVVVPETVNYDDEPYQVVTIGELAFYNSTISSVSLPNSVITIEHDAFSTCPNLLQADLGEGVTYIGESAFYHCSAMRRIEMPPLLTVIEQFTFSGCAVLDSVVIPPLVTKINQSAFYNCVSLNEVVIPNSVTLIDRYAFWSCMSLHTLTIGTGVTMIESMAFANTTALKTIYWNAKNVPNYHYIDYYGDYRHPFTNAPIQRVVFGDEVEAIPGHAFEHFPTIESVYIGASVTKIGDNVFDGCIRLANITSAAMNPPSFSDKTFNQVISEIPVYVPCEAVVSYQNHQSWSRFHNIGCDTLGYHIFVMSNVPLWGTVSGGGVYQEGEEVTLSATPSEGFLFENWCDGELEPIRTITVSQDRVYVAMFKRDENVGINFHELVQLEVYPNPTTGYIQVDNVEVERVEVYNLVGYQVMHIEHQSHLDLSTLNVGVYMLRIITTQGPVLRKIIKK